MTTAKELYAKVSSDLDSATRECQSLKAEYLEASSRISNAESELHVVAWKLMPEAREALPEMFKELSAAFRGAEESMASCDRNLQDKQNRAADLKDRYERSRENLGTYADGERTAMRQSGEYSSAEANAAGADATLEANAITLAEAEKKLARLTELARQTLIHRMLLSARNMEGEPGHFLLSLWNSVGGALRNTAWFRRMDADRADAERNVGWGCEVRDKARSESAAAKDIMQRLNSDFETTMQPRRLALQQMASELEHAQKAEKTATTAHKAASKHLADLQACRVEPAGAARTMLISVLGREFGVASKKDLATIKALAERPAAARLVERAMECAEDIREAAADRISITEKMDAIQASIDELEKVKRKMSRSGLNRSSKMIDNADTFMASDMSDGGFDLETLTMIAIVADAVSDMGSGSTSDWSSSSSWGSSFE
jgi:hypothetical protein